MKIVSQLFSIALAVAVLAPGIDVVGAVTCAETCEGCIGPSPTTGEDTTKSGTFPIPAPTETTECASGPNRYIRSLLVSETGGKAISVAFKNGDDDFSPVPQGTSGLDSVSTQNKYCSWTYANVGKTVALSGNVGATVTCTEPNVVCNLMYKVSYGCPASTCATVVGGSSTAKISAGQSKDIKTSETTACASGLKRYIKSLKVSEDKGLGIVVTFAQGTSTTATAPTAPTAPTTTKDNGDPAGTADCYFFYENVGKALGLAGTLTDDVVATVKCADPAAECNIHYEVVFGCPASACATALTATDGSTPVQLAAGTTSSAIIKTTDTAACPWGLKRYISSLKVSEDKGLGVAITFAQGTSTTATPPTAPAVPQTFTDNGNPTGTATCYFSYADVGLSLAKTAALTDNVVATVKCADNAAACNIKHLATFKCPATDVTCPTSTSGLTSRPLTAADTTGFVIPKPAACPTGRFNYLKTLDVRGDVVVSFNQGLNPTPAAKGPATGATCFYYTDVRNLKTKPEDVVATVRCTGTTTACAMSYKAEWACSDPIVFTRTKTEGDQCAKVLSACENRCAKSYQLSTSYTAATTTEPIVPESTTFKFTPLLPGTGCTCDDFLAKQGTVTSASIDAESTNPKANVAITEPTTEAPVSVMTITSTETDTTCVLTYKRMSFANQFIDKPYTRTTPGTDEKCTPVKPTATDDEICAYKCAAELTIKPTADKISVTKAAVAGCKCGDPVELYVDGDGATAGTDDEKYEYDKATGVLKITTTTTGADNAKVTCPAEYKESCNKLCTDPGCGINDVHLTDGLKLTNIDGCPAYTYSYPKSVVVRGLLAENDVSIKSATAIEKPPPKCYKTYGQLGGTLASIGADFTPTVSCGSPNCKAAVNTVWGCTDPKCVAAPTDFTKVAMTAPNVTGFVVKAPAEKCAAPLKAYLKSLDIRLGGKDINVAFNNGLNPAPSSKGLTCQYYSNVIGLTAASTDVTATISCASTNADGDKCDVAYSAVWGCYTPAAAPVYTRKGAPEGRGCVTDLSTCASRCAKSYQLVKTDTDKMLVPQITPEYSPEPADKCYCPVLTATTDTSEPPTPTKATNPKTTMEVNEVTASNTLTVEYTAPGKECKTTFAKAAFANSFVAETYARGTVTPATCVPVADADATTTCAYKCAAELSIKPLGVDALNVTQAVVTSPAECTCNPFMAYVDVDGVTASSSLKASSSVEIKQTTGALTVKTTTGSTVCTATYTKKTAPPPPATAAPTQAPTPQPTTTTKTGTSAGVSALGAGADAGMVTVTLVAAAAGVQAVGLPA